MYVPRVLLTSFLLVLATFQVAAAEGGALSDAIENAVNDSNTPFQIDVFCTNAQSRRSLTVFRGAVGVWNGDRQVKLPADDRRALLQMLLDAGFADFDARYGEQKKADKQEAPLRAICRVSIAIAGIEKTSIQLRDGEQSPDLLGLAGDLLDRIEPRAAGGVVVTNLKDGLVNLAHGAIAPELLELRLLRLLEDKGVAAGFILRVRGSEMTRQPYVPGQLVGDIDTWSLDGCMVRELADILIKAGVWDLPRNVHHEGIAELEVAVLGSRYSLSARSSFRSAEGDIQARFERMIGRLEEIGAECLDNL